MSKHFFTAAFAVGLMSVGWVGWGFVGSSWLALVMTAVIGGVYLLGAFELRQFRAATAALASAMTDIPQALPGLGDWLDRVPPALRNAVRLRIEGERGGLPGPALTPYLVGLLVMLGMLGTFLGMVVTFKGAVFALEGSTDLQAIRSALAAPIKGLGLSFGASVAGVAASAMLGLMSAISRRERLEVARQMDGLIATVLRPFSLVHQRQETFKALQAQAHALPQVLDRLDAMTERIERRSQQLDEQLLGRQAQFQREVTLAFTELAQSVGASLKDSLADGARSAAESIRPVVQSTLTQMAQESERMQERLGEVAKTQVDTLSQQFSALLASVNDSLARTQSDHALAEQQRQQAVYLALETIAGNFADGTRELRHEMSRLAERDNLALQERTALVEQLGALLQTVNQAGAQFSQALDAHTGNAANMAAHITGSALELSSLAEAFGQSVQLFQASNDKLTQSLQHIEASINRSTARSDEQLAYYVAQAREVIDLSIASQEGLFENLRQLQGKQGKVVALADGGRQ